MNSFVTTCGARRRARTLAVGVSLAIAGAGLSASPAHAAQAGGGTTDHRIVTVVSGAETATPVRVTSGVAQRPSLLQRPSGVHAQGGGWLAEPTPQERAVRHIRTFPATAPAASVPGLLTAPAETPEPPEGVRISEAMQARLAAEGRAARAAERAQLGASEGFSRPLEGARLTSGYGQRWGRLHAGIDYAGPVGLTIRAVAAGTVTIAETMSGYGQIIEIEHDDGHFTRYAHLNRIRVEVGDRVEPAQDIAALGNTGRSTGPHLHFEVRKADGSPVDPTPWLEERQIVPVEADETAD
ncbi:MAG: M23 family metallopeptidase [Mobilicoccus sp.]|nr:M23 family metallopeptidase [Mobilicoccus sp.]